MPKRRSKAIGAGPGPRNTQLRKSYAWMHRQARRAGIAAREKVLKMLLESTDAQA